MSLEKHFPTFTNSKEQNPKKPEGIKSLGKKAFPYIAALTTFFGIANSGNAQTTKENNTQNVEWKLTSPDGKQTRTFKTKEERDAFARAHNLQIPNDGEQKKTVTTTTNQPKTNTQNAEWKLTSPDGKQTKVFKTKEERDAFAKAHNLNIPNDGVGGVSSNNETTSNNTQDTTKSKTANFQDYMNQFPNGKGKVIKLNNDGSAEELKVKKTDNKIKIKRKKNSHITVIEN